MPVQPINHLITDYRPPTEEHPSLQLPDETVLSEKPFLVPGPGTTYNSDHSSIDVATRIAGRSSKTNITNFSLSYLSLNQQSKWPRTCPELPGDAPDGDSDGEDYIRLPAGGFGHQYLLEDPPKRSGFVSAIGARRRSTGEVETTRYSQRSSRDPSAYVGCVEKEQDCSARRAIAKEGETDHNKAESKFSSMRAGTRNADVDDDKAVARLRGRKVRFVLPVEE